MNNNRSFVPGFLKKIDNKLLLNKPTSWSARTHLVLYFAALFGIVLAAICFMSFYDAKEYSNVGYWVTFIGLIAFIGFVFWMIFLLRFNVFKRYGTWYVWDGLKSFILYFVSIGAMVAICFIPSAIETFRANQQFGNNEIVNDINEININACKLEYDLLPLNWTIDTIQVVHGSYRNAPRDNVNEVDDIAYSSTSDHHYVDTAEIRTKLFNADSVIKMNDSIYIFYQCPDYTFVNTYSADEYTSNKVLKSAAIWRTVLKNFKKPDKALLQNRMQELKVKYAANSRYSYYDTDESYSNEDSYDKRIKKKYSLFRINNGIDNATQKKYEWMQHWDSYLRIFYYITLTLTLLVFIFRHTTAKTFFLSLLAAVILAIFSGLLIAMSGGNETSILSFMLVYYAVFIALSLSINAAKVRSAIQGIGLNLLLFMTPFIPLICVALNEALRYRNYNNYQTPDYRDTTMYFLIAEISGGIILLVLIEPFFRRLYRKWYSAPEQ